VAPGATHVEELVGSLPDLVLLGAGVGGARNRMKLAKFMTSSNTAWSTKPPMLNMSLCGACGEQFTVHTSKEVLLFSTVHQTGTGIDFCGLSCRGVIRFRQ